MPWPSGPVVVSMPLVRKFVGELFQCADFEETRGSVRLGTEYHKAAGPQLNLSQNPDEAGCDVLHGGAVEQISRELDFPVSPVARQIGGEAEFQVELGCRGPIGHRLQLRLQPR